MWNSLCAWRNHLRTRSPNLLKRSPSSPGEGLTIPICYEHVGRQSIAFFRHKTDGWRRRSPLRIFLCLSLLGGSHFITSLLAFGRPDPCPCSPWFETIERNHGCPPVSFVVTISYCGDKAPPPFLSEGANLTVPERIMARRTRSSGSRQAENYRHPESESPMRPDVGTQAQVKNAKPPATYRYDSSLDPQLVWSGKAERLSFDVPTLPLFVHERLSTKAIIETLKGHKRDQFEQASL